MKNNKVQFFDQHQSGWVEATPKPNINLGGHPCWVSLRSAPTCKAITVLLGALLLNGCASFPDFTVFKKPETELPQTWPGLPEKAVAADHKEWWKLYGDEHLNTLVEEALAHNHDIALAAARIEEARVTVVVSDAESDPTATATFLPSYSRSSRATATPMPGDTSNTRNFVARVNLSYDLDFWGRLRRATEAARADLLAAESARDTVRNTLTADMVQGYYNLLALDEQLAIARRTESTRQSTLKLQQLRLNAGVSSEFEVRQIEADLAAVQAQIPALSRSSKQQENALSVLLGRSPRAQVEAKVAAHPTLQGKGRDGVAATNGQLGLKIPAGLPSELLLRRPDLRQAEHNLAAANARVNVARAAFYPSISLTGFLGGESESLADLFIGPARIFRFAAELTQPLFNSKRLGAGVDVAKAREDQLVTQYKKAIANAFREVQDALAAQQAARDILAAEEARALALQQALMLAKLRFDNGIASQLEMLDAERNLLQAQYNKVEAERLQRVALADLFKAMGGGWQGL